MTTPAQSQAKVFNPSAFQNPDDQNDQSAAQQSQNEQKEYPVTGNSARDSVRKMLYELYQGDSEGNQDASALPLKFSVAQIVELLENDIFYECKDPKSKQYRDKTRAVQIKLKGPRFEQSRKDLRSGIVDAKTLIRDDYVQGKSVQQSQQNQQPQQQQQPLQQQQNANLAPRMMPGGQAGAPGFRAPGPGGMRPRMMGPPGGPIGQGPMFRPPMGAGFNRPPVPIVQLPQQQQPIQENINASPNQQNNEVNGQRSNLPSQRSSQEQQNLNQNPLQMEVSDQSQKFNSQTHASLKQNLDQSQKDDFDTLPSTERQTIRQESPPHPQAKGSKQSTASLNNMQFDNQNQSHQNKSLNGSIQYANLNQQQEDIQKDIIPSAKKQEHEIKSHNPFQQNEQLNLNSVPQASQQNDQSSVDISHDKAIGIDDSIISNEKKVVKKKKKVKKGEKAKKKSNQDSKQLADEQILEENVNQSQQQLVESLRDHDDTINDQKHKDNVQEQIEPSKQASIDHPNKQQNQDMEDELKPNLNSQLNQNYQFLDQSSSVIIQDKDESMMDQRDNSNTKQLSNINILDESQLRQELNPVLQQSEERQEHAQPIQINEDQQKSKHSTQERMSLLQQNSNHAEIEEERKTPQKHRSKQRSIDEAGSGQIQMSSKQLKDQDKVSKNQSVKSLAHSSSNYTQPQIGNIQMDSDNVKRLQDALSYKRQQKKELTEKIVHLENDIHLQQRKATMLMEENKSVREELRIKDRELKSLQQSQNERVNLLELQNRKLEGTVKEKQTEIEQLKIQLQRQKDEKYTYKERVQSINEESQHQKQMLDNLLRALENRVNNSSSISQQIQGVSSSVLSVASGNQSEQVEQIQREFRDMKTSYEQRIRDLTEELNNKTKQQQRTERQNLALQERNHQLQELLSQVELQQLSTVAGSGSNQRDSTALLNRRQGGGSVNDDTSNQHTHRAYEEEGTGGDGGYNQSSQINTRNQTDYLFADEGGNAAVISGLSENFENDSNQNIFDGGSTQRNQRAATQSYQLEAVSGGHPQFEDEPDQEDDIEDEEDYDEDDVDNGNNDDYEDEEGNQYEDNTQGIGSTHPQSRDNQATGHAQHNNFPVFQGDINEGYAGGQQTLPPRQRKQGSRRRGNRQQNQQHATGTGQSSSILTQNPRQRNTRGRQQRSNQQIQQQQLQIGSQQTSSTQQHDLHPSAPSQAPSSQYRQNQQQQQQQNAQDYFQNYGDSSSSIFMSTQNRDQSASSAINVPQQLGHSQREGPAAGSGVVLTAGRQNAVDSMMSAESGSTATAFLDKNQFHRGQNVPQIRQQNQPSSLQSVQQNQIQFQTGSNNSNNQQQQNYQQVPSDLFNDNDGYTAAVGAPTSRAAAHPRQSRQQPSNQSQQQNAYGVYHFVEESKQSSGEIPTYYQQQNANQSTTSVLSSVRQGTSNLSHNQFVGGSGEQEEESSSGYFAGGARSGSQQNLHHYQPHGGAGGPGSAFDSTRRTQQMRQGLMVQHPDQSHNNTRNDSRKTSGANTPNKDGADTPTTKAYRGQQQQNSYAVHNLTSNQLFFSNQDEGGDSSQLFGGGMGSHSIPQIHAHQQQNAPQQMHNQQQQQQYGRDLDVISSNMFD